MRLSSKNKVTAVFVLVIWLSLAIGGQPLFAAPVDDLQSNLRDKLQRVDELKKKAADYESGLIQKRQERFTLSNQVSILSDLISKTGIDIEATQTAVEATNLEIESIKNDIQRREDEIASYKSQLAALIRWLDREQKRTLLEIFFIHASFADFYRELRQIKTVQINVGRLVEEVESLKNKLSEDEAQLEDKRQQLQDELRDLSDQRLSLEGQQETKKYILQETQSSERKFSALLEAAKMEQEQTSLEITNLEKEVRQRLQEQGLDIDGNEPTLIWPVPHARGISAIFHDPDYPFRRIFEHSGIDIRAYQATAVRAAASGYVAKVTSGGARGYGYIMIIHNGGLATVYGHVSKITISQDSFIAQGEIIALSGGIPGTPGAGPFSTGPHLHFETRLNGIPVNPMQFLPR